jgi:hypothetical protein
MIASESRPGREGSTPRAIHGGFEPVSAEMQRSLDGPDPNFGY